jgi:hypothetical protein
VLRQLTENDIPAARALILEQSTFQARPLLERVRDFIAFKTEQNITKHYDTQPYYGEFDDEGNLLSFIRIELWDPKDQPSTCTMGLLCTTNKVDLPRAPNSRWSQTAVNVLTYAFEQMAVKGIRYCYTMIPDSSKWVAMGNRFPYEDKLTKEIIKEVEPNTMTGDPLLDKYVLQTKYSSKQLIIKMTRHD